MHRSGRKDWLTCFLLRRSCCVGRGLVLKCYILVNPALAFISHFDLAQRRRTPWASNVIVSLVTHGPVVR